MELKRLDEARLRDVDITGLLEAMVLGCREHESAYTIDLSAGLVNASGVR